MAGRSRGPVAIRSRPLLLSALVLVGCGAGSTKEGERLPIELGWVGLGGSGLFATGEYWDLGERGPEPAGESGLLDIDPATGTPRREWNLGPVDTVLGLAGGSLVTADTLSDPPALSLLPLRSERPAPVATFDGTGGCAAYTVSHGLLPGGILVLPCTGDDPAGSAMVLRVEEASFSLLGLLGDECPLSTTAGEELWCLSEDGTLRRYALSDLSLLGELGGLPATTGPSMARSNLALPAPDRIGVVPPLAENPEADTYELWEIPGSGDAVKLAGIELPAGQLGWCQDAWWTGTATCVVCDGGSALVSGDPLAAQATVEWPSIGSMVAPLDGGRLAVASGGVYLLDDGLQVVGGYHRQWQENSLTGDYSIDEGGYP